MGVVARKGVRCCEERGEVVARKGVRCCEERGLWVGARLGRYPCCE